MQQNIFTYIKPLLHSIVRELMSGYREKGLWTLKLLLHPIVCVYTHKCAANIVEKYERSLVVG